MGKRNAKQKTPYSVWRKLLKDETLQTQIAELTSALEEARKADLLTEEARLCLNLVPLMEKQATEIDKLYKITEAYERFESLVKELYPGEFDQDQDH